MFHVPCCDSTTIDRTGVGNRTPSKRWVQEMHHWDWDKEMALLRKANGPKYDSFGTCRSPFHRPTDSSNKTPQKTPVGISFASPSSYMTDDIPSTQSSPQVEPSPSTRAQRNQSIISSYRVKSMLRETKPPNHRARGADITPFPSSTAIFRKRLLHLGSPGISQWSRRHLELKNDFLNVYMRTGDDIGQLR